MKFAMVLKELRKKNHYTQDELAKKLNVAKSTISMYECGERMPTFETMEAIADLFNVDMDVLYARESSFSTRVADQLLEDANYVDLSEEKKPTAVADDELEEDVIIFHRDGKTQKRKFTKEQMAMFMAMVDAIPETPEDN